MSAPILLHIEADQLQNALLSGIAHVQARRDLLNRINVFPVPDGDTGTNLLFTLQSVRKRISGRPAAAVPVVLDDIADAALDGARGNSGAILAQFFHGLSESSRDCHRLDAHQLARSVKAGAVSAWSAMSKPVAGTMPTVLEDFGDALVQGVEAGVHDIRDLFGRARKAAHASLKRTPDQLPVLREAGVVDAGAQGFVDLVDGIWRYVRSGKLPEGVEILAVDDADAAQAHAESGPLDHRFCTECLIDGDGLDVDGLRERLDAMDASSLVVAGGGRRARVHIHTNKPGDVFRVCAEFGEIRQQKADDMSRQHGLINQRGAIVVTDSAADLPAAEIDRLGIHTVPLRLFFGDTEYLDKLSMQPSAFYAKIADSDQHPQTSQPPPRDFRRQFELLTSHGHEVLSIHISGKLSGTLQSAEQTARRLGDEAPITVYDSLNAACGQALLTLWAAEAAAAGWSRREIVSGLDELGPKTRTFALARDLTWGVRGGRVKPWMEGVARHLRLNPVLANSVDGRLTARGVVRGRGEQAVRRFARFLVRRMEAGLTYRILISQADCKDDARLLRELLLTAHPEVDACWIEDASPAVGVHAGPGCLIVGLQPWTTPD